MNAKIAFTSIVLAAGFAGNALADAEYYPVQPFTSTKTRAEVRAELDAYRASFAGTGNPASAFTASAAPAEPSVAVMGAGPASLSQSRLPNGSGVVLPGTRVYEAP